MKGGLPLPVVEIRVVILLLLLLAVLMLSLCGLVISAIEIILSALLLVGQRLVGLCGGSCWKGRLRTCFKRSQPDLSLGTFALRQGRCSCLDAWIIYQSKNSKQTRFFTKHHLSASFLYDDFMSYSLADLDTPST